MVMQDVYDFFYDVNSHLTAKGLQRLDEMLRPAIMSGLLSDMLTSSLARHSRVLTENQYFNGHRDFVLQGLYGGNSVRAREGMMTLSGWSDGADRLAERTESRKPSAETIVILVPSTITRMPVRTGRASSSTSPDSWRKEGRLERMGVRPQWAVGFSIREVSSGIIL